MILVSYGCDKCGKTETREQPRTQWGHQWMSRPGGWEYDDVFLYCIDCKPKDEHA